MQGHPPLFGCEEDKFILIFRKKTDASVYTISNTFQIGNKVFQKITVKT